MSRFKMGKTLGVLLLLCCTSFVVNAKREYHPLALRASDYYNENENISDRIEKLIFKSDADIQNALERILKTGTEYERLNMIADAKLEAYGLDNEINLWLLKCTAKTPMLEQFGNCMKNVTKLNLSKSLKGIVDYMDRLYFQSETVNVYNAEFKCYIYRCSQSTINELRYMLSELLPQTQKQLKNLESRYVQEIQSMNDCFDSLYPEAMLAFRDMDLKTCLTEKIDDEIYSDLLRQIFKYKSYKYGTDDPIDHSGLPFVDLGGF